MDEKEHIELYLRNLPETTITAHLVPLSDRVIALQQKCNAMLTATLHRSLMIDFAFLNES
jgi:hypothetical protein